MKHGVLFLGCACALAILATEAPAQTTTTGVVTGHVVDPEGNPIPDAIVTAYGSQVPRVATTDSAGRYTVPVLPPGSYTIKAQAEGFGAVLQQGVQVSLQTTVTLNFTLSKEVVETVTRSRSGGRSPTASRSHPAW